MNTRLPLLLSCVFLISAACTTGVIPIQLPTAQTITPDPFSTPIPTPFRPATYTPTNPLHEARTGTPIVTAAATGIITSSFEAPAPVEKTLYRLDVALDYAAHSLFIDETVVFTNLTLDSLPTILLAVEPNRWDGVFTLISIQVDSEDWPNYTLAGHQLEIMLADELMPSETIQIYISFRLVLPRTGNGIIFGYNNAQMNLVDWFPIIVPYEAGNGWLLHKPAGVGEHLVYETAEFIVVIEDENRNSSLVVAASSLRHQDGHTFAFHLDNGRSFSFSASTNFAFSTTMVGTTEVTSYYFSEHTTAGKALLQAAVQAIEIYSDLFAPYPHGTLSIVETYTPDGLETDGMFFLSNNFYSAYSGLPLSNLISIGVHEVAHQWWFSLVGNDQAMEPWLDEALCVYSELLYYENMYPHLAYSWWNFRVAPFNPTGYVNISVYEGYNFRPYVNAVYLRGAYFIEALRELMGDAAFFAFLREYTARMAYQRSTAEDFFQILDLFTAEDYSNILSEYFKPNQ